MTYFLDKPYSANYLSANYEHKLGSVFRRWSMNLFDGLRFGGAVAIGAAAVLLTPIVLPVVGSVMKPIAKGLIKGGILAYEGVAVALAETIETIEDITAEAKAEITESRKPPAKTKKQATS
jgi:Protein of unknown function (DUF5132)